MPATSPPFLLMPERKNVDAVPLRFHFILSIMPELLIEDARYTYLERSAMYKLSAGGGGQPPRLGGGKLADLIMHITVQFKS